MRIYVSQSRHQTLDIKTIRRKFCDFEGNKPDLLFILLRSKSRGKLKAFHLIILMKMKFIGSAVLVINASGNVLGKAIFRNHALDYIYVYDFCY